MHKFTHTNPYETQSSLNVEVSTDAVTIDELLRVFKQYLLACGFADYGQLDFVADDDDMNTTETVDALEGADND